MILDAIKKWKINKRLSFLIGDKDIDIQAARAAKIQAYKFTDKNLYKFLLDLILFNKESYYPNTKKERIKHEKS